MAKFIYRMQSILDVKMKLEEQAKHAFAAAKNKVDEEEEKLNRLFSRKAAYEEEGKRLRLQTLDFLKLAENQNAVERMEELIAIQENRVRDAKDVLQEARDALALVMMERKAQEILKEKAFEEFRRELIRAESKEVDELTSYTYGRAAQTDNR